tara:strand:- start:200 stop:1195 length:996 start_codon:yes stop_codon:yes gene_type:complete
MIISKTPYRISFFGGGTDYPEWYLNNGGQVLATSIDKYSYITCRHLPPFFDHRLRLAYSKLEHCMHAKDIKHPSAKAVLMYLGVKKDIEIHHDGDLPARSGIGSSSTFTVGLFNALSKYLSTPITKYNLAKNSINIEQKIIGEHVGSQDQITASYGGFNHIKFKNNGNFIINPINSISKIKIKKLEKKLMLFHTGIFRTAENITKKYVNKLYNKANHLNKIHSLVDNAIEILKSDNIEDFGHLLNETWKIKREISNNISNNFIDDIYNYTISNGAIGGKLLGAGGGGFILFYVPENKQKTILKKLSKLVHVPFKFEFLGSQIIYRQKTNKY